jgi:CRISPR-associated protein Csd1
VILQSLYEYYQRKAADPESGIAPEGFEWKEIPFVVVVDETGAFVTLEDTREGEGKKRRARRFLVPAAEKKSVNIKANLLWDNVEYALGANPRNRDDISRRHAAFLARVEHEISPHPAQKVLLKFLRAEPITQIERQTAIASLWSECLESNANVTFRLEGSCATVCETLAASIVRQVGSGSALCLVSGTLDTIARLHPAIKGVRDAQSSGAALVSFNLSSFCSYNKEQNHNAPVGDTATFAYTTALNGLLGRDSKNKVQVGDATTVFWSDRKTELEDTFFSFWSVDRDNPDRDIEAVETLLKAAYTGAPIPNADARFFVLGLSPNAARVSVRFWYTGAVSEVSQKLGQHFRDLELVRPKNDKVRNALFFLLSEIALENKIENIPPNLAGNMMRAILTGGPYPATLLQQTVRRIRATRQLRPPQVALLKAYLVRRQRFLESSKDKEIEVALDTENTNAGYLLGRLFAALEKIQEDAQPGINTTIRDRYYGAASATPVSVYPQLLKLKNHHLAKIDNPAFRITHEKRLAEIFGALPSSMPAHLTMDDQARFAIGYYHQRQALFTKSERSGS